MLDETGIKEDMEVLLFAHIKRGDASDDLIWLLKRGSNFLFVEKNDVVRRMDIKNYVLSRIVKPKRLSAIIRALKSDKIEDASEVGKLEKEAILLLIYHSEDDQVGATYGIQIQSFDAEETSVDGYSKEMEQ